MGVREFAETIFFGKDLESKLIAPLALHDNHRGDALWETPWPGRPPGLTLQDWHVRPRLAFPGAGSLVSPRARGHALHFFANHELLALELMALALLRFPDAPQAFRRGLVSTMREEQDHLRAYVVRMNELGVSFGEAPVNDFFWRTLSGMRSPLDFVVRMSLTFEQANLDFALAYEELFASAGDKKTAQLMRQVHDDEVGHVRHGLAWLRAWKKAGVADWDAYCEALPEELSPARAKGQRYFVQARREVGFDDDYIQKLGVYSRSKGRPPLVWIFNPTVEMDWSAAALGKRSLETANEAVRDLVSDFAALPAFLSAHDDIVLVESIPSTSHLAQLAGVGFSTPEFVPLSERQSPAFASRKLGRVVPWGWSQAFREREATWLCFAERDAQSSPPEEVAAALADKNGMTHWERVLLKEAKEGRLDPVLTGLSALVPEGGVHSSSIGSMQELSSLLESSRGIGPLGRWVAKAPLSSSGRERVFFDVREGRICGEKSLFWMQKRFESGVALAVEPWLERVADFSVQIQVDPVNAKKPSVQELEAACRVLGVTRFACDAKGRYFGTALGRRASGLPRELLTFLYQNPSGRPVVEGLEALGHWLGRELARKYGFRGPLGLDTFLYRNAVTGQIFLRPFVEFNPRFTMGRVALELGKRVAPQSSAAWLHVSSGELQEPVGQFWTRLNADFPAEVVRADPGGTPFLCSGALATNDPHSAKRFLSVLVAHTSAKALVERCAEVSKVLGERARALFPE